MRKRIPLAVLSALAGLLLSFGALSGIAAAQDWSPFDPFSNPARGQAKRQAPQGPASAQERAPQGYGNDDVVQPLGNSAGAAVERGDLAPVMAADGSGLPYE